MNQVKNRLLELLTELHVICNENNIKYTLSASAAAFAVKYGDIPENTHELSVYMTLGEYFRFEQAVCDKAQSNRVLEGMNNNNKFPGLYYRYTDMGSTYYNYNFGDVFNNNGIHINIEILRNTYSHQKELVAKEKRFAASYFRYKRGGNFKAWVYRKTAKLDVMFGRNRKCQKLYNSLTKHFMTSGKFTTAYSLVKPNFGIIKYPSYLYTAVKEVNICGHTYIAAANTEYQYRLVTGRDMTALENTPFVINSNLLISAELPFSEFLNDGTDRMKIAKKRQHFWITDRLHGAVIHFINRDWSILQCVSARLDLIKKYMPQKDKIKTLYSEGCFEELAEVMYDYDTVVRDNFTKSRMTIYFNKDIHAVYISCLSMNGEAALASRLNRRIPDKWRKETI